MTIQNELLAIQEASVEHMLHPSEVISWAQEHPGSSLYRAIEWDDGKAAHQHRLWQVRQLIKLHVVDGRGEASVVSLSIDRVSGGGYRAIDDLAERPDLQAIMVDDALADLQRVENRWKHVKELEGVWRAANETRIRVASRKRVRQREPA